MSDCGWEDVMELNNLIDNRFQIYEEQKYKLTYDLQDYKDLNDVLNRLDINIVTYPRELCSFVDRICHKYNIKATKRVYDAILDFMLKIEKDLKNQNVINKKTNYPKEYQEMIMSLL